MVWTIFNALPSPPAALLAVSIRQAQSDELSQEELPSKGTAKVRKADSWKANFCAEMCAEVAGKVDQEEIFLPPEKGPTDERL